MLQTLKSSLVRNFTVSCLYFRYIPSHSEPVWIIGYESPLIAALSEQKILLFSKNSNFVSLVIKGSKMNISRLLSEVKSPKSGSLIARPQQTTTTPEILKKSPKNENLEMRKRKLTVSPVHEEQPKKPFLMSSPPRHNSSPFVATTSSPQKSQIPRIKQKTNEKSTQDEWLNTYQVILIDFSPW